SRGPDQRDHQLDQRILYRYGSPAVPAAAAQEQPAEDRYVVTPAELRLTRWTARRRSHHRLLRRPSVDAYVQERADSGADHAGEQPQQPPGCLGHEFLDSRYMSMPAATPTLSDSASPLIGTDTN